MTIQHQLKLIPARFRWAQIFLKGLWRFATDFNRYDELVEKHNEALQEYLSLQRKTQSDPKLFKLEGRVEAYKEIAELYRGQI